MGYPYYTFTIANVIKPENEFGDPRSYREFLLRELQRLIDQEEIEFLPYKVPEETNFDPNIIRNNRETIKTNIIKQSKSKPARVRAGILSVNNETLEDGYYAHRKYDYEKTIEENHHLAALQLAKTLNWVDTYDLLPVNTRDSCFRFVLIPKDPRP